MNPLQQVFVPPILSAQTPIKFIIEVANSMYWWRCVIKSNIIFDVVLRLIIRCVCVYVLSILQVGQCEFSQSTISSNRLLVFLIQTPFQCNISAFALLTIWFYFIMTAVANIKYVNFYWFLIGLEMDLEAISINLA